MSHGAELGHVDANSAKGVQRTRYLDAVCYGAEPCYLGAMVYGAEKRVQKRHYVIRRSRCVFFSKDGLNYKKFGE
jgi:hypothetical protein